LLHKVRPSDELRLTPAGTLSGVTLLAQGIFASQRNIYALAAEAQRLCECFPLCATWHVLAAIENSSMIIAKCVVGYAAMKEFCLDETAV
jgi:hypothetical protein